MHAGLGRVRDALVQGCLWIGHSPVDGHHGHLRNSRAGMGPCAALKLRWRMSCAGLWHATMAAPAMRGQKDAADIFQ